MEAEDLGVDHEKEVKGHAEWLHLVGIILGCVILNIYANGAVWFGLPTFAGWCGETCAVWCGEKCGCKEKAECCERTKTNGHDSFKKVRFKTQKIAYFVVWIIWVERFDWANQRNPDKFDLSPVDTFDHCPKMGSLEYWGYNQTEAEMACNEWPRLDPDFHTISPTASDADQSPWTCDPPAPYRGHAETKTKKARKLIPKYKCQWLTENDEGDKMYRGKCVKAKCPLLFRSYPIVYEFGVLILTLAYFVGFGIDDLTDRIKMEETANNGWCCRWCRGVEDGASPGGSAGTSDDTAAPAEPSDDAAASSVAGTPPAVTLGPPAPSVSVSAEVPPPASPKSNVDRGEGIWAPSLPP